MAIVSSGAVSLSDIATEFGGSQPHSMSEYYSGGSNVAAGIQNASGVTIPTSGQISLASNFYGSVAEVVLLQTTITAGNRVRDAKLNIQEFGFSDGTGTGGSTFGTMANKSISSASRTVKNCFLTGGNTAGQNLTFTVSNYTWTGWTKLVLTRGTLVGTLLRSNATHTNVSSNNVYGGNLLDASGNNISGLFSTNAVTNFKLIQ
tara:strand:+ start:69 stop:680 length:612 start_codon:yes stop_codon:yes gene_type:complete